MSVPHPLPQNPYGAPELSALAAEVASEGGAASAERAEAQLEADREVTEELLWQRHVLQGDMAAREALILMHLPYARAVAATLYRQHVHHETEFKEYVQLATLGLIEALDRFDPQRGAKFRTYAYARVMGSIRNGLEHISERQEQISLHRKLLAERVAAAQGAHDLSSETQTSEELMRNMAEVSASLMLSFMLDDTGMLQDPETSLPDGCYESLAFKHERQHLHELVGQLTPREQSVVRLHYLQGMTYQDIANSLGITKGRVAQLHEQAMQRLRKLMAP